MTEPGPSSSSLSGEAPKANAAPDAHLAISSAVPEAPLAIPHAVPEAPQLSTSRWGRRASRTYVVVCALALLAMAIETVLGHPGTGSMIAAILAAPWSMLVAGFAPPLPRDWPLAAGLAVRMVPLALFMLLNAAVVRGIAARSERDLARTVTRVSLLLLLTAPLGSGCILSTRQEVFVAAPKHADLVFFGGWHEFDLTTSPQWLDQHGKIARIRDLAIVGDFTNTTGGPFGGTPAPIDVKLDIAPDTVVTLPSGIDAWGPIHLAVGERKRVDWDEGERLMLAGASTLEHEIRGDGKFMLYAVRAGALGGVAIENLRIMAVFELK